MSDKELTDLTLPSLCSTLPNETAENFHDASDQINEIIASYEKAQQENSTTIKTNTTTTSEEEVLVENASLSSSSSSLPEINQIDSISNQNFAVQENSPNDHASSISALSTVVNDGDDNEMSTNMKQTYELETNPDLAEQDGSDVNTGVNATDDDSSNSASSIVALTDNNINVANMQKRLSQPNITPHQIKQQHLSNLATQAQAMLKVVQNQKTTQKSHPANLVPMLNNQSIELSEVMKERQRRQVCEQQIQRLQQKILNFQQKIRVQNAAAIHKQEAINKLDIAVGKLMRDHRERELRQTKKLQECCLQLKTYQENEKAFNEKINLQKMQISSLQEKLSNEHSNHLKQVEDHMEQVRSIQHERDDLWAKQEKYCREIRQLKSEKNHLAQELEISQTRSAQLELALEELHKDKSTKLALQEKEEICIGLQMDNESLKDQLVKMRYEKERVNSESLNFQNTMEKMYKFYF